MREKLQTLPLAELKEMARNQGIKGISSLRKAEIIDLLCAAAEKNPEVKPTEIRKEEKRQAQAQDSAQPRQETVKPRQDNFGICYHTDIPLLQALILYLHLLLSL